MNVGHPSNMARIVTLYGGQMNEKGEILKKPDLEKMKDDMFAISVDDDTTRETIKRVYERHKVLLEPHGSVGWEGLRQYFNTVPEAKAEQQVSVSLETAHPAKFPDEIKQILKIDPVLPPSLAGLEDKKEEYDELGNGYKSFKKYLIKKYKV
jgi:threonine synthase